MQIGLKTKKGAWVRLGNVSGDPMFPGGYKGYVYIRDAPDAYPKTSQQKKIAEAGRRIREKCKGKTGKDFTTCRTEVLREIFG
ncbi:MAG TPA: hypothetical protein ENF49_00295 [Candidatus Altiarchaeales archaeon]|nr:hypothetical protein [Candidatus Altiarchaeales archaeon]HEX54558.1 hypothetical protein [Candidatus Altiarchaeales archaeon]